MSFELNTRPWAGDRRAFGKGRALPWLTRTITIGRLTVSTSLGLWVAFGLACEPSGLTTPADSSTADAALAEPAGFTSTEAADPAETVTLRPDQMRGIELAPVESRRFQVQARAFGKVAFNEDHMTPVFSPYTGRVVRLLAAPGDTLKAADPLLEVDTVELAEAQSELIRHRSEVAKADQLLQQARRTEERLQRLFENKAAPLKELEYARTETLTAQSELQAATAGLNAARDRLRLFGLSADEIALVEGEGGVHRTARVFTPIGGLVTHRNVGPGQLVTPDSSQPLFTIADLSTVWVVAAVYESEAPQIVLGQPVEVRLAAFPGESLRARVSYIGSSVDPVTRRVPVRSTLENPRFRLKPDMFAELRILTRETDESPSVPVESVVRDGETAQVWVSLGEGRLVRRAVEVGLERDGRIQILSGVEAGEQVVSRGSVFMSNLDTSPQ